MGGAHAGPPPTTGADWFRNIEKRSMQQDARPMVRDASDLLGPLFGPFAVPVQDWSGDEAAFNGIAYSEPGAINSPDDTKYWIGRVMATADGYGIQQVRQFRGGPQPTAEYIREFAPGGPGRLYGAWTAL